MYGISVKGVRAAAAGWCQCKSATTSVTVLWKPCPYPEETRATQPMIVQNLTDEYNYKCMHVKIQGLTPNSTLRQGVLEGTGVAVSGGILRAR